tara:strand:+ start:302 stop:631 length:330 start_codon:yes stop_codon:yes gene_type:complete
MTKAENVFSSLEKSLGFRDPKTNVYEVKVVAEYTIELEADSPKEAKKFVKHWAVGEIIDDETYEVIDQSTSYNSWIFDKPLLPKDWKFEIKQPKKVATGWRDYILLNRK